MTDHSSSDPATSFELTALRLHLVVGMAAADSAIDDTEIEHIRSFVTNAQVSELQRSYLTQRLAELLDEPPALDVLLRSIVECINRPQLAQILIDDLIDMAHSDGIIDPREEGMLRLVCGALEIDPVSLYEPHERAGGDATAAELAELVRNLLHLQVA